MQLEQTQPAHIFIRLWAYQAERFPFVGHGLLIAAFSVSAISYSMLLRGAAGWPEPKIVAASFGNAFLFFLLLRIADEFKDHEEDARYRPHRPVPRGLVSLRELGSVGALCLAGQLVLTVWLEPALVLLLALVWLYLGFMSKEFFVRDWLKARPVTYLWSHMLIVPLIDFYTTACDWATAGHPAPPDGLLWFLTASFFNGLVIEVGRKIRAPQDEVVGVETYSTLWGPQRAALVWLGAVALTGMSALLAAREIGFALPAAAVLVALLGGAVIAATRFLQAPSNRRARQLEALSGLWTILMYLTVGAIPMVIRVVF